MAKKEPGSGAMRWSCCRDWRGRASSSSLLPGYAAIVFTIFTTPLSYAIGCFDALDATSATGTCAGFTSYGPTCAALTPSITASSGDALCAGHTSRSAFVYLAFDNFAFAYFAYARFASACFAFTCFTLACFAFTCFAFTCFAFASSDSRGDTVFSSRRQERLTKKAGIYACTVANTTITKDIITVGFVILNNLRFFFSTL
jgi:hypothetical protein